MKTSGNIRAVGCNKAPPDPLNARQRQTVEMLNAFNTIADPSVRASLLRLVVAIAEGYGYPAPYAANRPSK